MRTTQSHCVSSLGFQILQRKRIDIVWTLMTLSISLGVTWWTDAHRIQTKKMIYTVPLLNSALRYTCSFGSCLWHYVFESNFVTFIQCCSPSHTNSRTCKNWHSSCGTPWKHFIFIDTSESLHVLVCVKLFVLFPTPSHPLKI